MAASDEDKVDNTKCHNSQCWSHSAVSQVLICSISINKGKTFSPAADFGMNYHTARAPNLRHDLITAKFSSVIPKQYDWSIMIS